MFRIYFFSMLVILLGSIVLYNCELVVGHNIVDGIGFCAFIGLVAPFLYVSGCAKRNFIVYKKYLKEQVCSLTTQGFKIESPGMQYFIVWDLVRSIHETKDFIFIKIGRYSFTIYKKYLDSSTLKEIRELIHNVQVKRKKLTNNNKT